MDVDMDLDLSVRRQKSRYNDPPFEALHNTCHLPSFLRLNSDRAGTYTAHRPPPFSPSPQPRVVQSHRPRRSTPFDGSVTGAGDIAFEKVHFRGLDTAGQ